MISSGILDTFLRRVNKNKAEGISNLDDLTREMKIEQQEEEAPSSEVKIVPNKVAINKADEQLFQQSLDFRPRLIDPGIFHTTSCLCFSTKPETYSTSNTQSYYEFDNIKKFSKEFRDHLKSIGLRRSCPIQAYIWPRIFKMRSITCISGAESGKTLSYLIYILQRFEFPTSDKEQMSTTSPEFIIICSSSKQANKVHEQALWLKQKARSYPRFVTYYATNEHLHEKDVQGCQILITTPRSLLRLWDKYLIDLKQMKTLIIDDADVTTHVYRDEIHQIYEQIIKEKSTERARNKNNPRLAIAFQTLIYSKRWTTGVKALFSWQNVPYLIFGSFYEAAIFFHIRTKIHTCAENEKFKKLNLILKHNFGSKIAIVCNTDEECQNLSEAMKRSKYSDFIMIQSSTRHFDTKDTLTSAWMCDEKTLLIISDEGIKFFPEVDDVSCIIHYTVPSHSKRAFGSRFRLMHKWLSCSEMKQPKDTNSDVIRFSKNSSIQSEIILSENQKQIIPLKLFVARLSSTSKVNIKLKEDKLPLCHRYASFGRCPLNKSGLDAICHFSHNIQNLTADLTMPLDGEIGFQITCVVQANEIFIQLQKYRNESQENGKWVKYENSYLDFKEKLNKIKNEDRKPIKQIDIGAIYGTVLENDVWRVKVLKDLGNEEVNRFGTAYNDSDIPKRVWVQFIDSGKEKELKSSQLFNLPQHFHSVRSFAFKAYLCSIKPLDDEIAWDLKSSAQLNFFIMNSNTDITGWILLQRNGIFWLDNVLVSSKLEAIKTSIQQHIEDYLVEQKLADTNKLPWAELNNNKIRIVSRWLNSRFHQVKQQAQLNEGDSFVMMSFFNEINEFYVNNESSFERLLSLEDSWSKCDSFLTPLRVFEPTYFCFCRYNEKEINRALIQAVDSDKVTVFFLDHGETKVVSKSNCYEIEENYITTLPFQAIRCNLYGIKALREIDPNLIYDATRDKDEIACELITRQISFDKENRVYSIRLFVTNIVNSNEWQSLAKFLVEKDLAKFINGEENENPVLKVDRTADLDDENLNEDEEEFKENMFKQSSFFKMYEEDKKLIHSVDPPKAPVTFKSSKAELMNSDLKEIDDEEADKTFMSFREDGKSNSQENKLEALPFDPSDEEPDENESDIEEDIFEDDINI